MKREKGAITLFVLLAMLFFIMALVGTYAIMTNRARTEKEITRQVQESYNTDDIAAIYDKYMGNNIVPIYNSDHLKKINSDPEEKIAISDEGGKIYTFSNSEDTVYVLRNNITLDAKEYGGDGLWTEIETVLTSLGERLELAGHSVTVILLDGTAKVYNGVSKETEKIEFTYAYTGEVKEFIAPVTGDYILETWGAQRRKILRL